MKTIEQWVCPHILAMKGYSSARSEFKGTASVFLDANENTFRQNYNRYPDPLQVDLKTRIAALKSVEREQIFLGNGSDEAIDLLLRIFCCSGEDAIITLPPTYGMYSVSANLCNVENIQIPLTKAFQPDVEAILKAQNQRTKLLFICSPNNPTGNDIELDKIEQLLEKFEGIVVVDEAYIDFSIQTSTSKWLDKYPNLVVLQTFSKAWGMAGIRLGMAFANVEIIDLFNKVKPPYNINVLTQEFALERLANLADFEYDVLSIQAERTRLKRNLEAIQWIEKVYPSAANFLLVKMNHPDGVYQYLIEQGIIVRNRSKVLLCEGCLRITVGTAEENERLETALLNYSSQNESKNIILRSRWDYSH